MCLEKWVCLVCGPPPEIELRVTLVHRTLQSVLCLTHGDGDLVVLKPSPLLPSPPLLVPSPPLLHLSPPLPTSPSPRLLPSPPFPPSSPPPPLPSSPLPSPLPSCCLEVLMELFVCGPSFNSAALRHSVSMTKGSGQLPLTTASPPSTPVGVTSRFCVTHLKTSTSRQLFMEETPVVRLVLDTVDSSPSIWATTTNTCINKWVRVVPVACDMNDR